MKVNHRTCRKESGRRRNRARLLSPGEAWEIPAYCPGGVRHKGGASLAQAPVRNVGTCVPIRRPSGGGDPGRSPEGALQAAETARNRVPTRHVGTGRPVVAMKPGNAGGAKGAGYPGLLSSQP